MDDTQLVLTIHFPSPVKVEKFDDEGLKLSDGTTILDHHDQDCCEHVYADWKQLADQGIEDVEFESLYIFGKSEHGIIIKENRWGTSDYLVPCYNRQNGYYSSQLELIADLAEGATLRVDVSTFVEDNIG